MTAPTICPTCRRPADAGYLNVAAREACLDPIHGRDSLEAALASAPRWLIIDQGDGETAGTAPGATQADALRVFNRDALEGLGHVDTYGRPAMDAPTLTFEGSRYRAQIETSALQAEAGCRHEERTADDRCAYCSRTDDGADLENGPHADDVDDDALALTPAENTRAVTIEIGDGDLDTIAEALRLLAGIDEGEHVDTQNLERLADYLYGYTR